MNLRNIFFTAVAVTIALCSGCRKFVESGNVNVNPNQPAFVTLNTLLPAVENATANNYTNLAFITSMFSEQMAAYTSGPVLEDQNREVRIPTAYATIYQNGLTNSKILLELARTQNAPYYRAIARVLFVTNLALATDTWGDVPLTEAFQAPAVLSPKYDTQQDIYAFMQGYLDSAIAEAQMTNASNFVPGIDDLIFGGTISSWAQTAWFMKAKLYMHTTKKGAVAAANNALTAMGNAYTPASKVFQLIFSDRNPNPWFTNVSGRISGSQVFTIGPSTRFLDAMTGVTYPGLFDPRVDTLVQRTGSNPGYLGIQNGGGNNSNNTNLTDVTFFGRKTAPLLMGSYAEQKLMEAEARFLLNGGNAGTKGTTAEAYNAYISGIASSLRYLGYDTAISVKGKTYINLPMVRLSPEELSLEEIMRERQVVLFLNPEAWVDVRRYDYNTDIYPGLSLPANQNPDLNGTFIRRAMYPLDEINRNPKAASVVKPMTEKVWWDQ